MPENGLPKATMSNYIKHHISNKTKVSSEFIQTLLDLSKQFIDCTSARANQICEREGKKTINNEHFFIALNEMGMGNIIKSLQKTDETLKVKQQKKQEEKARVQQNIEKLNKRRSQLETEKQKQNLPIIDAISQFKPIEIQDDQEEDFVQILEMEQENEQLEQDSQIEIMEKSSQKAKGGKGSRGSKGSKSAKKK